MNLNFSKEDKENPHFSKLGMYWNEDTIQSCTVDIAVHKKEVDMAYEEGRLHGWDEREAAMQDPAVGGQWVHRSIHDAEVERLKKEFDEAKQLTRCSCGAFIYVPCKCGICELNSQDDEVRE